MRLYEGTIADFSQAVVQNEIADRIGSSYERHYRRRVGDSEYRAWQQSLNFLRNSFEYTGLIDNTLIIEYELPYSTRRIDVLVFGRDQHKGDSIVLIELKQWSNENVEDCLFKFFNSFITTEPDSIDVLVCDEAHRVRKTSNSRYTRSDARSNLPQIDELFRIAKLNIFFIDENQIVRPQEIGSVALIKEAAERFGIKGEEIAEFELKTQFRCSGSDAYLQWLDKVLGITDSEEFTFDARMQFKIFPSPSEMMQEIRQRNAEKKNCARIVAGFCWPWSPPNRDGSLVNDVKIGDFSMPWEKKDTFWKWATDDSGMEQVGTVYTAQGFEFDYIGVIVGNDLLYDWDQQQWRSIPQNSHDTQVKRNNPDLVRHLQNVYRVLLSRAHQGVYVHFMDPGTEKRFRSAQPELNDAR